MILSRISQLIFICASLLLVLVLAKAIFIPLAFALLIAYLLYPWCKKLERKIPRIFAISIVFLLSTAGLFLSFYAIAKVLQLVMNDLAGIEDVFNSFKDQCISSIASFTGLSEASVDTGIQENIGALIEGPVSFLSAQLFKGTNILFSAMITGILAFLMLMYRTVFKNFILSQVGKEHREQSKLMMRDIQQVSQQYMTGLFMVMGILGVLNSLGLWAIGVKYPLFWGFFAALLTIVPYAGTFAGGFFPFVFTLLSTSTIWQPAMVVVLFFSIQFLEDNFIKPKVVGQQIDLNPFTAILALLLGGVIWGIPGFVLALPYMAMVKIVLEHFEETEALATLFSSEVYDKPKVFQKKYAVKKYALKNIFKSNESGE